MPCSGAEPASEPALADLRAQNAELRSRVDAQQREIDQLKARLDRLAPPEATTAAPVTAPAEPPRREPVLPPLPAADSGRSVRLSGEAGFGYFRSGEEGGYPSGEFRVDDAKLFVEASVWENVYLFGGLEITTREASDEYFHAGEVYADIERLATGHDADLNLRVGRFAIPFGEEYQVRNVVDNPLIMHSVADLWGIDEGVQLFGRAGRWHYNLAVQNGGHKTLHDYTSDKAVVARLGIDATPRLHVSASAMRTGQLSATGDVFSELWIANAFFRALGYPPKTRNFSANLAELDAQWHWDGGHLLGTAGSIRFTDDNPLADDSRHLAYYAVEAVQSFAGAWYGAARYSGIRAPAGYPLVGLGNWGEYMYSDPPTSDLRRLSVGLGYRFAAPIVWKVEYSWEYGRLINGESRAGESDTFSTELAFRF